MGRSDIYRLFGNRVKASRVDQALGLLLQLKMAKPHKEEPEGGMGRVKEVWMAV
jgi:hypothetical protein